MLPLSQRITAPAPQRPVDTAELHWRAATSADLDAILDCTREMDRADHPHYLTAREELEEDFAHSHINHDRDSLLAVDQRGRVQAWGLTELSPGQETLVRSIMYGGVRPSARGRGIGRQLFAWQNDRALEQLASSEKTLPGWLVAFAEESEAVAASLYARFGFHIARYFLELTRVVREPIPGRRLPPGLRLEGFATHWSEAAREARNAAFRDHWGSQPVNAELWDSFVARSILRPDLSFLAIATADDGTEEVAGLVMSSVNEEDWEGQGFSSAYIDIV
ncbi:MAG: mycothiol synthase, partial [Microbacteriaceae bacterium]|nr:mycothiol synthase [Microbacteriaceae bacterium]